MNWRAVTDDEFAELVKLARETYNEGRWVAYPANHAWHQVVRAVLDKRAQQVGDQDASVRSVP